MREQLTARKAKEIWEAVVLEFKLKETFRRLALIKFGNDGQPKKDKHYFWSVKHFPSLWREWGKRKNEL